MNKDPDDVLPFSLVHRPKLRAALIVAAIGALLAIAFLGGDWRRMLAAMYDHRLVTVVFGIGFVGQLVVILLVDRHEVERSVLRQNIAIAAALGAVFVALLLL